MAKDYYLPRGDHQRRTWLNNFSNKINGYAAKYGITTTEVDNTKDGAIYYSYWLDYKESFKTFAENLTNWKNTLMNGTVGNAPTLPPIPTPPIKTVTPGIFTRVQSLAARIKSNTAYTLSDGQDLGIEGADVIVDPQTLKPVLQLRLVSGGFPEIIWKKQSVDALEIWRKEEGGTWHFLAVDTIPNYTDKTPLPEVGTGKLIKYKGIYKMDDENVGSWSDEFEIMIKGV